ncbi:MAG: hypothetical protein HQM12_16330 [SAR324 cluster bacterium]|nr:hypothetical protein [SAR324 cluster bacterium]
MNHTVIHLLHLVLFLIIMRPNLRAETETPTIEQPAQPSSIDTRSQESRKYTREPDFLHTHPVSRWRGGYFGIGLRHLQLQIMDELVEDKNVESNGAAYNIGLLWDERIFEYARHVSIVDPRDGVVFKNRFFDRVEIIQNNFWYIWAPRIATSLYFHLGMGLQLSQLRTLGDGIAELFEENSLVGGAGFAWFLTNSLVVQYRLSYGSYSATLSEQQKEIFLNNSLIQTLYWEYYFSL